METLTTNRKITVVDSNLGKKVVLEGVFNTFGELKAAARTAGVNVDQDWIEGITKTKPMDDSSVLPTNVTYKGDVTNNLVYMLTNTNKKTKSGATRAEMITEIKALGLEDEVRRVGGKRTWMNCSNAVFEAVLANSKGADCNCSGPDNTEETLDCNDCDYKDAYDDMVLGVATMLVNFNEDTLNNIYACVKAIQNNLNNSTPKDIDFDDSDINDMFK